jgi:uncharacterized protein
MFDALVHARALRPRDVEDLRFFGISGALFPAADGPPATAGAIRKEWEAVADDARRLRKAGLLACAALGIPPQRIPLRGLEALLHELPELLGRPEVAAVGPVGLYAGTELEASVLERQLALARELRLPVLAQTPAAPSRAKERVTRQLLGALREAEVEPARVLVAHADARTVKMIRACGFLAAPSLSRRGGIDEAVRIVSSLGPEGIVLASDAGLAGGDPLALARAADRLRKAGLSLAVVRRVCGDNALAWLGIDPRDA